MDKVDLIAHKNILNLTITKHQFSRSNVMKANWREGHN